MAGYIGSKASVTQVDGYNTTEADAEFVNDPNGVITVDSGNVGIGTSSPTAALDIDAGSASGDVIRVTTSASTSNFDMINSEATHRIRTVDGSLRIGADHNDEAADSSIRFEVDASEAMRIDSSGNLLVGKTARDVSTSGIELNADGTLDVKGFAGGNAPLDVRRNGTDGDGSIIIVRSGNTTVGSLRVDTTRLAIDGNSGATGIKLGGSSIIPRDGGSDVDNLIDLGSSTFRWDDVRATNGTIQTSDANEKQQIASLTTAEITAAKAISQMFKTFKWNSAVTSKGDAARTHTGVIAQEVETAMTDAGLDAGDYAFFISDTWWEDTEDYTDDDGVQQTRTNTYDTLAEAPAGATERTRKGIRYPELLSFVGAATEQRLADIETRLTALEAE